MKFTDATKSLVFLRPRLIGWNRRLAGTWAQWMKGQNGVILPKPVVGNATRLWLKKRGIIMVWFSAVFRGCNLCQPKLETARS